MMRSAMKPSTIGGRRLGSFLSRKGSVKRPGRSHAVAVGAEEKALVATVGLETHVQLKTKSKTFCECPNRFGGEPNSCVCPVCMGHPGTLPVFNRRVVDLAILAGLALHGDIQASSKFDRKQYFYPDLPKGYQISQYDIPFCTGGHVEIFADDRRPKRIGIERMHIEEDAGKSLYSADSGRLSGSDASLIDFNRAGVPLLEIVSKPEIESGSEAAAYGNELRRIVRYLGVSDGNMEEGSMRCDVNISVAEKGSDRLGTKVEIKNMNSFSFIAKAIDYEFQRQSTLIREGRSDEIVQETRLWNESSNETYSMRSKEGLADYRYFPEPDLPTLTVPSSWISNIQQHRHEFPSERRSRYFEMGLSIEDVSVLTDDAPIGDYFDSVVALDVDAKTAANWIMGDVTAFVKNERMAWRDVKLKPETLKEMIGLIDDGVISGKIAKQILPDLLNGNGEGDVKALVESKGLLQISDPDSVASMIDDVLGKNPKQLQAYKDGKQKLFGFFVGQVMQASKGRANPSVVNTILKEKLK